MTESDREREHGNASQAKPRQRKDVPPDRVIFREGYGEGQQQPSPQPDGAQRSSQPGGERPSTERDGGDPR